LHLTTAKGAAWRGLYLNLGKRYSRSTQLARITLDPHDGIKPKLETAVPVGTRRSYSGRIFPKLFTIKVPLPWIPWSWAARYRVLMPLYKLSRWLYSGLDGRYGWKGSCKR